MLSTRCRGSFSSFVADSGHDLSLLNLFRPNRNSCKFLRRSCPLTPGYSRWTGSKSSSVLAKAAASEEKEEKRQQQEEEEEEENGLFKTQMIYLGKPDGPTCHTGAETCYFTAASDFINTPQVETKRLPMTSLYCLEDTISQRKLDVVGGHSGKPSWTKRLLEDQKLLCSKIREEASELCHTLEDNEDKSRTASEMADVLYHAMVLLAVKNVKMEEVLEILRARFGQSGIEEKNSRKSNC